MNALCYKIVFSKRLGTLVAVGEHTVGQGKTASGSGVRSVVNGAVNSFVGALSAVFAAAALTFLTASFTASVGLAAGPAANALPSGASVNSGSVAISSTSSSNAATMNITQTTDKASVNWNSFNIGSTARVNVQQNSASSVLLNRVVGNDPSQIFGKLSANGQVILINPNGIVFGSGGSVTASAFTASTFGLSEQDFANNKYKFTRSGSAAGVTVKDGAALNVTAPGGYIALIGASVDNQGRISTQQGAVVLAAGESVALPASMTNNISVPLSGKVRLELLPSTINAMVANSGTITTEGGQVLMQTAALSDAVASITHTGTIDTTGAQGGAVTLLADGGVIKGTGSITANSSGNDEHGQLRKGGDIIIGRDEETSVLARATDVSGARLESLGGFVETSGDYLKTDGISVKAKDWLLDPTDINIVATGTVTPDTATVPGSGLYLDTTGISTSEVLTGTIQTAINNGTNVTISTANSAVGANGSGNITIFDKLAFANNSGQDATLTLLAKNGIEQKVGAAIIQTAGSNNRKVNVVITSEGLHGGNSVASTNSKGITLNAAITTNGDVTLNGTTNNSGAASASNAIGVDIKSAAAITAKNISITGKSESSFGIQSASVLNATNTVTLDGTSKNWVGVVTNAAVTAGGALTIIGHKTSAAGYQGININSALKGTSVAITGDSVGHYGVGIGTLGSVESTGTPVSGSTSFGPGDVTIIGTGTGNTAMGGSNVAVGVQVLGDITAKGKLSLTGIKDGSGGYQGVTINKTLKGDSIEVTGTSNAWDAVTFTNATFIATKTLKITADSKAVGKGILFSGGSTNTFTADSYLVTAKTKDNNGIYFSGTNTFNSTSTTTASLIDVTRTTAGGETIYNAGTLTINSGAGKATVQTSTANLGGGIRINGGSTVNTSGDVTIGSKNTSNAYTFNQGTINAQGNLKLLGQSTGDGIYMQDSGGTGSKIVGTNGANITLDGTSSGGSSGVSLSINSSANSITSTGTNAGAVGNISITGTSASGHGISNAAAEVKNTSTNNSTGAKGNVTLTGTTLTGSGQGIYNVAAGLNAGLNAIYAAGDLTLKGYSVNSHAVNTSGTLEAGGLLKIEGTAIPTVPLLNATSIGIYVGNTVKGGTVSMTGTTGGSKGIEINAGVTSTIGDITLTGTGGGNYYDGQGAVTRGAGSVNSAAGITIKGTATASGNNINTIGTQIQGAVTAATDILVEGRNLQTTPNFGLSIENSIKSTGGKITVTAENTSGTKTALSLNSAGKLWTGDNSKAININTNGMDLATGAVVQAGVTGAAGTVNIKTIGNNNISVGSGDAPNNSAASQTLGISQAELNQIQAGNVVIGDTGKTGNITVSNPIATATTTGNLTLQTGGNIEAKAALTVGDAGATKNLTLNGAGATSAISQTAAGVIKTAGLELLGANAAHTLTNTGNNIKKLAGNTKTVSLTNNQAFAIDTVNTVGLTTTGNTTLSSTAAVTQTQAIKAAGLALVDSTVGTKTGTFALNNENNEVGILAANAKTVSYTNKTALAIGDVGSISGVTSTGDVSVTTKAGDLTLKKNLTAANVNLNAAGAVLRDATAAATDGIIKASLLSIKAGAGVGTSTSRIKTDVVDLSIDSVGDQYITEANSVNVAAKSTGGNIEIATTNGTLTVRSVNSITGITTNGTGNVVLNGTATGADGGVRVLNNIDAGGGISITGQSGTKHGVSVDNAFLTANGPINITGTSGETNDVGVIIWKGSQITANNSVAYAYENGKNAISIRGLTSTSTVIDSLQRNVVINNATITNNSNNGNTYIYGEKTEIALDRQSVITNASSAGAIQIVADNNAIISAAVSNSTPIAQITQNSDKGVSITSNGAGNVEVANVINNGKGDVVLGAGISRLAGDGTGGQVKTNTDSKVKQNSTGNTYLYTGNANDTDPLSTVGGFANGLFLSNIGSDTVNAASNTAYASGSTRNTITGGAKAQVMFREKVALSGALNNATVTYGDSTNSAAVKAALQATNTGASNVISTASNAGTFKILNADLIADMATGKPSVDTALSLATNKSTSGNLKANSPGYGIDISGNKYTLNTTAKLVVGQKSLSALYAANDKVYDGNNSATVVGSLQNTITGDLVNPTHTGATFDTFAVGTNKTVTVTGISLSGVDLANYKIDPAANPTFTATALAAITPSAPPPPAPVVPNNATSGRVKIPLSAANPFQLASAEELGGEDFCENTSIDPLNGDSTGSKNSSCTCEDSKLTQDAQICFEKNTQKISAQ